MPPCRHQHWPLPTLSQHPQPGAGPRWPMRNTRPPAEWARTSLLKAPGSSGARRPGVFSSSREPVLSPPPPPQTGFRVTRPLTLHTSLCFQALHVQLLLLRTCTLASPSPLSHHPHASALPPPPSDGPPAPSRGCTSLVRPICTCGAGAGRRRPVSPPRAYWPLLGWVCLFPRGHDEEPCKGPREPPLP